MLEDLIQRSVPPCKQCMKDAGVDASKINEVVLVGGQTRKEEIGSGATERRKAS